MVSNGTRLSEQAVACRYKKTRSDFITANSSGHKSDAIKLKIERQKVFIRHLKKRVLVQNQGSRENQNVEILKYFEYWIFAFAAELGSKDFFEIRFLR
jgi:hypothetical protein